MSLGAIGKMTAHFTANKSALTEVETRRCCAVRRRGDCRPAIALSEARRKMRYGPTLRELALFCRAEKSSLAEVRSAHSIWNAR